MASAPISVVALLVPIDVFSDIQFAAARLNLNLLSAIRFIVRSFINSHLPAAAAVVKPTAAIVGVKPTAAVGVKPTAAVGVKPTAAVGVKPTKVKTGSKKEKTVGRAEQISQPVRIQPKPSSSDVVVSAKEGSTLPWRVEHTPGTVTKTIPWRAENPTFIVTEPVKSVDNIKVEIKEEPVDIDVDIPEDKRTICDPGMTQSSSSQERHDFLPQSTSQSHLNASTSGAGMTPAGDDQTQPASAVAAERLAVALQSTVADDIYPGEIEEDPLMDMDQGAPSWAPGLAPVAGSRAFIRRKRSQQPSHPQLVNRAYWCHLCGERLRVLNSWREHMRMHRSRANRLHCKKCKATFLSRSKLNQHMVVHRCKCELCGTVFARKSALRRHLLEHAGVACAQCEDVFMDKEQLRRHSRTHTDEDPYTCGNCNARFEKQFKLIAHMNTHAEKLFQCDHCDVTYTTSGAFMKHRHSVKWPRVRCDKCDEEFRNQASRATHVFNCHSEDQPPAPGVFTSTSAGQGETGDPISDKDTGDKPSECNPCGPEEDSAVSEVSTSTPQIKTHLNPRPTSVITDADQGGTEDPTSLKNTSEQSSECSHECRSEEQPPVSEAVTPRSVNQGGIEDPTSSKETSNQPSEHNECGVTFPIKQEVEEQDDMELGDPGENVDSARAE